MKEILMSIRPEWCKRIFNGEKTIEVRKTRPIIDMPFKVFVYETKAQFVKSVRGACTTYGYGRGKVIGSFVCDRIREIIPLGLRGFKLGAEWLKEMCLSKEQLDEYGGLKTLYSWHITEPKLFDKPRELGEFYTICNKYGDDSCGDCPYLAVEQCSFPCDDCVDTWCSVDNIKPITRPPQSWCYVEEVVE